MKKQQSGFTLIELLVVVAIIGILAAVVLVAMNNTRSKARDTQRKSDMRQLKTALELYKTSNNGKYPITGPGVWLASEPATIWYTDGNWIPGLSPTYYQATLPRDPAPSASDLNPACISSYRTYLYRSDDGTNYKILAHCTSENMNSGDPFIDPVRATYSFMVCSAEPACSTW